MDAEKTSDVNWKKAQQFHLIVVQHVPVFYWHLFLSDLVTLEVTGFCHLGSQGYLMISRLEFKDC